MENKIIHIESLVKGAGKRGLKKKKARIKQCDCNEKAVKMEEAC